ncbi:MAG TPA: transglycosylase SLT domain-containing protein [Ferruginibacter sp.]|nr:transglycosylase SLT domain-containing protein [Ferruginibacter sp.]HRQ19673.1 transglycosylase SLT domain-containing protein [Ferruginibacter sp.]
MYLRSKLYAFQLLWMLPAGLYAGSFQWNPVSDTLKEKTEVAAAWIDEIITEKKEPEKEKVEYISQLTRYGFKNLFEKYSYNPGITQSAHLNPQASLFIRDYLNRHSDHLLALKDWGAHYFNLIDQILTRYGLPRELKYLAVIESNLQASATSWAGAAGPWQFMPVTAREYGLQVNQRADERRDYFKSTHAASRYLLNLYKQFNDWLLVIAAYNGGPGRVYEAIKKSGSRNFWELQYYLPEESRNHVKKFIATHYIMENEQAAGVAKKVYHFKPWTDGISPLNNRQQLSPEELAGTQTQTISGKFLAAVIARHVDMSLSEFNRYNPSFNEQLEQNGQFDMMLPEDKMNLFLANMYQILNESVQSLLNPEPVPATRTVYPKKNIKRKN